MAEFSWHPPLAACGDTVMFRNHAGQVARGRILHLETKYGLRGPGPAYHNYGIRQEGHSRCQWVGDDAIVRRAEEADA